MRAGITAFGVIALALSATSAYADCPTLTAGMKPESYIFYNSSAKTYQFCDGTNWVAMFGSQGPPGPAGDVPSGAVMPFDLANCPDGWSEYTPAYGRFVRGIDRSGTNIDPAGERAAGNVQSDELASHSHSVDPPATNTNTTGAHSHNQPLRGSSGSSNGLNTNAHTSNSTPTSTAGNHNHTVDIPAFDSDSTGGAETRPKNVALLYCRKN